MRYYWTIVLKNKKDLMWDLTSLLSCQLDADFKRLLLVSWHSLLTQTRVCCNKTVHCTDSSSFCRALEHSPASCMATKGSLR